MVHFWCKKSKFLAAVLGLFVSNAYAASTLPFLVITDIHLNTDKSTMQIMPNGYKPSNDLDLKTYQHLIGETSKAIKDKEITKPQFILLLGDLVGHEVAGQKVNRIEFVKQNQLSVFRTLKQSFPNTPIISVFGNNDAYDQNYGNYSYNDPKTDQTYSIYRAMQKVGFADGFLSSGNVCSNQHIYPCLIKDRENAKEGYAVIKLQQKLDLVILNSVMFSNERPLTEVSQSAIMSQLIFLKNTLEQAQSNDDKVMIAMHIPVGKNIYDGSYFWHEKITQLFLDTIRPYASLVIGILNGHTHMEEFKKVKLDDHVIGEYTTAGLSTSHGNLPSIKLFSLQKDKQWQLHDYQAYRFTENDKNQNISLSKLYSFDQRYCQSNAITGDCLSNITFKQIYPEITLQNPNYMNYKNKCTEKCFIVE